MKKRRTEQSQKRTRIIFIVIIVAALISITATYAWFSSQRDVEIVGFRLNVEIAENLEISLDGETWTHTINVEDMRQFYGTYRDRDTTSVAHQANNADQRNYVPTELLPVSSVGKIENGNLVFVTGEIKEKYLEEVVKCSEADVKIGASILEKEAKNSEHPYLAFDMYLKNLSRLTEDGAEDLLQLNSGSIATAAALNTGLEYGVRIGLVKYDSTVDIWSDGETARAIEPNGSETVAIWEPNHRLHTSYIVKNDERINNEVQEIDTYAIKDEVNGVAVTEIADTTDTTNPALEKVFTNKFEQYEETATQNFATKDINNLKLIDGTTNLSLKPNTITKVRCYIWLEGQDPDCIDLSSTGQELIVTLRMIKPSRQTESSNSYAD